MAQAKKKVKKKVKRGAPTARRGGGNRREQVRQKMRESEETRTRRGSNTVILPDGIERFEASKRMELAIVPYKVSVENHPDQVNMGDKWYRKPFKIHRNVGIENKTIVCPKSFGLACPICEEVSRIYKKAKDAGEKEAKRLRAEASALGAKDRDLFNVYFPDKEEEGVMVWDVSYHNFSKKLNAELTDEKADEDWYCFWLEKDGYTLKVRMAEETLGENTFLKADRIDFEERKGSIPKAILEQAVDLDTCLRVMSYDEIENLYLGAGDAGVPDEHSTVEPFGDQDQPECFGKEFDDYEDCAECASAKACEGGGEEEVGEEQPECFGKEYDDYEDCSSCEHAKACEGGGEAEAKEEKPECFGKEFDAYEDCADCSFAKACKGGGEEGAGEEEAGEEQPECFGKEFDAYEDCASCGHAKACEGGGEDASEAEVEEKEEQPECFSKEFGVYEDCTDCSFAKACEGGDEDLG
ncbi:hypothetical protein LCGC14_0702490, partial [marine sediment metagenome]